jgi:Putative zinc-finger
VTNHWTERLSAYLDAELTPADRAACEAHLAGCPECRTVVEELASVIRAAQQMHEWMPATDLWPSIAARLEPPGAEVALKPVRVAPDAGPRVLPWTARHVTMSLPQLGLAASFLVAVSAGLSWLAANRDVQPGAPLEPTIHAMSEPVEPASAAVQRADFADAQFDAAVADLEQILIEHRDALDPRTVRVLERNLQAIDEAIRQARQALDRDPANTYLNSHLVDARQRKLALLRRAALLASEGG